MALQIRFGDEIEAEFVGKIIEVRVVRLVGSTNGVDVALLHPDHVGTHSLVRHGPAGVGVVLVSVHTVYDDRLAVHQHVGTTELNTVEADLLADVLLSGVENHSVKSGCLSGPQVEVIPGHLHGDISRRWALVCFQFGSVWGKQPRADGSIDGSSCDVEAEEARFEVIRDVGNNLKILDR